MSPGLDPSSAMQLPSEIATYWKYFAADDRPTFVIRKAASPSSNQDSEVESVRIILRNTSLERLISKTSTSQDFESWLRTLDPDSGRPVWFVGRLWTVTLLEEGYFTVNCHQYVDLGLQSAEQPHDASARAATQDHDSDSSLESLAVDFLRYADITKDPWITFFRNYAWEKTPLGAIDSWHPLLWTTAVSITACPNSRIIYWGNDMKILYNEATVAMFGGKHPSALGYPHEAVWGPRHHAAVVRAARHTVKRGKAVTTEIKTVIERNGAPEDAAFTFYMLPLVSLGGQYLGVVCELVESTETYYREDRLKVISNSTVSVASAKTLTGLWDKVLTALNPDKSADLSYALLYRANDNHATNGTDGEVPASDLIGSTGITDQTMLQNISSVLRREINRGKASHGIMVMQTSLGTLPPDLAIQSAGHGLVDTACIIPITDIDRRCLAYALIGINPRRAFDDNTKQFLQTLADIFIRKAAVIDIDNRTADLVSSQIFRDATVGVYRATGDGKLLYCNQRYYDVLGMAREGIETTSETWMDAIHPDDIPAATEIWKKLLSGQSMTWACRLKAEAKPPFQGFRWVETVAVPELDHNGNMVGLGGWMTDITDRKYAETITAERLRDAVETKKAAERFTDTISHELRNPLSAILQLADSVLSTVNQESYSNSKDDRHTIIDAAETIILCAQHQKGIVDDILTVSKLDSKLVVLSPDVCELLSVPGKAMKMFESQLKQNKIDCRLQIGPGIDMLHTTHVIWDSGRVLQIIINLVVNAIKFVVGSVDRTITIEVAVSADRPTNKSSNIMFLKPRNRSSETIRYDDDSSDHKGEGQVFVQFSVHDSGPGMSEEEIKHLFYRFSQASSKTYKQYGGSGLGLFISRELAELHGGQIGLRSKAGVGTTFTFYVEAKSADVPVATSVVTNGNHTTDHAISSTPIKDVHILLVEDNAVNQRVMSQQLRKAGCATVHVAENGLEALAFLKKTTLQADADAETTIPISLILLDVEMPIMDGLETATRIREMESTGEMKWHIPIIAITANARKEQIRAAIDAGMDDVVTKPFRIPDLVPRIEGMVGV